MTQFPNASATSETYTHSHNLAIKKLASIEATPCQTHTNESPLKLKCSMENSKKMRLFLQFQIQLGAFLQFKEFSSSKPKYFEFGARKTNFHECHRAKNRNNSQNLHFELISKLIFIKYEASCPNEHTQSNHQ